MHHGVLRTAYSIFFRYLRRSRLLARSPFSDRQGDDDVTNLDVYPLDVSIIILHSTTKHRLSHNGKQAVVTPGDRGIVETPPLSREDLSYVNDYERTFGEALTGVHHTTGSNISPRSLRGGCR